MVDGDEYLIELVKQRAPLWNKEHDDYKNIEFKKLLWRDIADKTGSDDNFLRRRWTNLREKFVRVLRYNEVYAENFKYYSNMLFLKKHIHLRGVTTISEPEQNEAQNHLVYVEDDDPYPGNVIDPKIELNEPQSHDGSTNNDSDDYEFTITEEHINQNSDTEEVVFVELASDEEEAICQISSDNDDRKRKLENSDDVNITSTVDVTIKKVRSSTTMDEGKFSQINNRQYDDSYHNHTQSGQCVENRCEDQIFGELVTAMLLKMNADTKKKIKKEIMNILLQ